MSMCFRVEMQNGKILATVDNKPDVDLKGLTVQLKSNGQDIETQSVLLLQAEVVDGFIVTFPLPTTAVIANMQLNVVLLQHGKKITERELKFSKSDDQGRPIVVSNLRPNGLRIQGWVVPVPDHEVRLSFFVNGAYISTSSATTVSEDIRNQFPETKAIMNGFAFAIPEWCYDGSDHECLVIEETSLTTAKHCPITITPASLEDALFRRINVITNAIDKRMKNLA